VETYSINGVPHFHNENTLPLIRVSEQAKTHPHSQRAKKIIDAAGLVLDLGAGIPDPDHIPPNMVLTDAVHSPNLDVVNTCGSLPFKDNAFDAVISQAVFEHVRNPFLMAREVHRILKPGGIFYLTTAFMQPLHGDPSHYYNMTMNGLKDVLADFDIEEIGIEPSQQPSYGIQMAIEAVLPFMRSGNMKDAIEFAHEFIVSNRSQFDNALGPVGRETLAAGFYSVGKKTIK
jgi:SAM-dependent methyltransferase